MNSKRRNSPPRSYSGREAERSGVELVMFSSRIEAPLDDFIKRFIRQHNVRKQDLIREALLLLKEKYPDL